MRAVFIRFLLLFLLLALLVKGLWVLVEREDSLQSEKEEEGFAMAPVHSASPAIVPQPEPAVPGKKASPAGSRGAAAPQVGAELLPGSAAGQNNPLQSLIDDSVVLQTGESVTTGGTLRQTIYRTPFKYPLIRVDEEEGGSGLQAESVKAMVADHVMVQVPAERQDYFLQQLEESTEISLRKSLDTGEHFLVTSRNPVDFTTVDRIVRELRKIGFHDSMPDYMGQVNLLPDDPSFDEKWGLHNTGQSSGTADADIDAPEAWDTWVGDRSVTVAVVDTGIDYDHPDLSENMWQNDAGEYGYDYVEEDTDPNDQTGVNNRGHGTHVAGIIGAVGDNAIGVTGVCWKVKLMAVRVIDEYGLSSTSLIISGVRYAVDQGAHVINLSLRIFDGEPGDLFEEELARAKDHGVLACIAAGNGGSDVIGDDNDIIPQYPAGYDLDNIISVAAMDSSDALTYFSNYGLETVDLGAPGSSIYSTLPVVDAGSSGYGFMSGTSMATPFVAGAAALGLSLNPSLDYASLRALLLDATDPLEALDGKIASGGRLNIERMVQKILSVSVETSVEEIVFLNGNGDAYANPGEEFALRLEVFNAGGEAFEDLSAELVVLSGETLLDVTQSTEPIGPLGISESLTVASGFAVSIHSPQDLPASAELRIDIRDAANPEAIWSEHYVLRVYSPGRITGEVVRRGTGLGIPGATVHFTGPVAGTATTGEDGSFDVGVISGIYSVHASAPDLIDSTPVEVASTVAALSIELGKHQVEFLPDVLNQRSGLDEHISLNASVEDSGDAEFDLEYSLSLMLDNAASELVAVSTDNEQSVFRMDPLTGGLEAQPVFTVPEDEDIELLMVLDGEVWIMSNFAGGPFYFLHQLDLYTGELLNTYLFEIYSGWPSSLWSDGNGNILIGFTSYDSGTSSFVDEVYLFNPAEMTVENTGTILPLDQLVASSQVLERDSVFVVEAFSAEIMELDDSTFSIESSLQLDSTYSFIQDIAYLGSGEILVLGHMVYLSNGEYQFDILLNVHDITTGEVVRALEDIPAPYRVIEGELNGVPEWVYLGSSSGVLASQTLEDLPLSIDSTGLEPGTYKANLILESDTLPSEIVASITLEVNQYDDLLDWLELHQWTSGDLKNDPDGDGYTNLEEYLFKGNPLDSALLEGQPVLSKTAEGFEIEMLSRSRFPDGSLAIQHSIDLQNWQISEAGVDYQILSNTEVDADYERMQLQWLKNEEEKLFIRTEATIDESL